MQDKKHGGSEQGEESTAGGVSAVRKGIVLAFLLMTCAVALPNTVTNDVVVATSDAELRISDRGLGLGLEVVGGGAAEVKLEARPGWRFRDGSTSVTLMKAAGEAATSPEVEGEGKGAESYVPGIEVGDDDEDGDDEDGSVEHEKPVLSLTASAPKVVAYSVNDGGASVSIALSATVTTKGKHRKLDADGNVVEETEFLPKRYVWKMTGAATGEAETDSSTHTFAVNLTKGESKRLNFSVVGKTCSICDGEVASDAATDSVEIDVYEIRFITPSGDPAGEPNTMGLGQNEFTYIDKSEADGGVPVACINLNVGIDPAISGGRNCKGKFTISGIEGVEIQWEDGGDGEVEAQEDIEENKNHFVAHPKYKNYPPHNSGFGRKTASFTFAGATIENDFEVFFPKFGNNHPACTTCPGCSNWFYYWKEGDVCSIPKDARWIADGGASLRGWHSNGSIYMTDHAAKEEDDFPDLSARFWAPKEMKFSIVETEADFPELVCVDTNKSVGKIGIKYSVNHSEQEWVLEECTLKGLGGDGKGIGCAAAVAVHENGHKMYWQARKEIKSRYDDIFNAWSAAVETYGADSIEAAVEEIKRRMFEWQSGDADEDSGDGVIDNEERSGAGSGIKSDMKNRDTYNFAQFFDVGTGYSEYGDEEIRMRAIERTAVYYVELDWANPGCQYSDKPYGPKK